MEIHIFLPKKLLCDGKTDGNKHLSVSDVARHYDFGLRNILSERLRVKWGASET